MRTHLPMTRHRLRFPLLLASTSAVSWLTSCEGVDQIMQSHYRLDTSQEYISKGDNLAAIDLLETMLSDLEPQRERFVLQRFYACYLLTEALILQALSEAPTDDESRTFRTRRMNPRVMPAMLYLGCARDVAEEAASAPRETESGKKLLPGRLDNISVEDIRQSLELVVVGFYGGLRFNDRMRLALDNLKDVGDLSKYDSCQEIFERLRVIEGLRPWIMLAIHRALRLPDPREAYRFGIAALHSEASRLDRLSRAEVIEWIKNGSDYEFLCTKCDEKVLPDRPACFNCGESYLNAYGVEREQKRSQ